MLIVGDVRSEAVEHSIVGELGKPRKLQAFYEKYRLINILRCVRNARSAFSNRQKYVPAS
jgi:hypothetical protein